MTTTLATRPRGKPASKGPECNKTQGERLHVRRDGEDRLRESQALPVGVGNLRKWRMCTVRSHCAHRAHGAIIEVTLGAPAGL